MAVPNVVEDRVVQITTSRDDQDVYAIMTAPGAMLNLISSDTIKRLNLKLVHLVTLQYKWRMVGGAPFLGSSVLTLQSQDVKRRSYSMLQRCDRPTQNYWGSLGCGSTMWCQIGVRTCTTNRIVLGNSFLFFCNAVPDSSKIGNLGYLQIESEPANYDNDSRSDELISSSNFETRDFESSCQDEPDQFMILITKDSNGNDDIEESIEGDTQVTRPMRETAMLWPCLVVQHALD